MTATLEAPAIEPQYVVHKIPLLTVFNDTSFNCRGVINPFEVQDLATGIKDKGLQFPIAIQPRKDVSTSIPEQFAYRIIAGHRRYMAYRVLHQSDPNDPRWQTIPAMIKEGLDEVTARLYNLSENLDRKDLNILQEAFAIKGLQEAGVARDRVAAMIKKSSGWVQTRYNLLELEPEIQEEAAKGKITQLQIKQLYSLPTAEERYAAVRNIKAALERGEKIGHVGKKQKQKTNVKKNRGPEDILRMSEVVAKQYGYGLTTRFAAWCTGAISTEEFFKDLAAECDKIEKKFYPPELF